MSKTPGNCEKFDRIECCIENLAPPRGALSLNYERRDNRGCLDPKHCCDSSLIEAQEMALRGSPEPCSFAYFGVFRSSKHTLRPKAAPNISSMFYRVIHKGKFLYNQVKGLQIEMFTRILVNHCRVVDEVRIPLIPRSQAKLRRAARTCHVSNGLQSAGSIRSAILPV